jgi:hypothetical protein
MTPSSDLILVPQPLAHANTNGWVNVRKKKGRRDIFKSNHITK